jgi:F-type H+-transporting ATPase subunit epsilon
MAESAKTDIHFELVSPERKLVSEPVRMAVIPSIEGDFGAMAGHTSVLAALRPGVIALYRGNDNQPEKIFVGGGFADVTAEICTVLAEYAVNVNDIDRNQVEQDLRDLGEDLGMAEDAASKAHVQAKIEVARAKLQAVTGVRA